MQQDSNHGSIVGLGWFDDGTIIQYIPLLNMMVLCSNASPFLCSFTIVLIVCLRAVRRFYIDC